jgi:predicted PurR-regulated permease PerM
MVSYREYLKVGILSFLTLTVFVWFFSDIIKPFFVAAIIAYFFDPLVEKMEKRGVSRILSISFVMIVAVGCLVLTFSVLVPNLIEQINILLISSPDLLELSMLAIKTHVPTIFEQDSLLEKGLNELKNQITNNSFGIANEVVFFTFALMDLFIFFLIAPVITFYLLMDWNTIVETIDSYLPRSSKHTIQKIMLEINSVLGGFVRGQLSVCLILGFFYSVSLMLVGLNYGLLIGIFSGLISFIPFLGAILGLILAISFSLFQFWDEPTFILLVACIFVGGQILEGNFLTPKLVGNAVKLHPVWLMFSLSIFGSIAGFTGLLLAVPVAAIIGVLCRYVLRQYLESEFYKSESKIDHEE